MNLEDDAPAPNAPAEMSEGPPDARNGPVLAIPEWAIPRVDDLIIEDGQPVESIYFEKLMRLLTEALYSSWPGPGEGRTFGVFSDVGLFPEPKQTPLAPDVMLSLDVPRGRDLALKENNSYFVWMFGKPPDAVIEFVSDRRGGEATYKFRQYARIGVTYYVIYDPKHLLGSEVLRAFSLVHGSYQPTDPTWLPGISLGLRLWEGDYESEANVWLRWCDRDGNVIPTGYELAELERQRAEDAEKDAGDAKKRAGDAEKRAGDAEKRAGDAEKRAGDAEKRAERLTQQLRALGVEPPTEDA